MRKSAGRKHSDRAFSRFALGREIEVGEGVESELGSIWIEFIKRNSSKKDRFFILLRLVEVSRGESQKEWEDFAEPFVSLGIGELLDAYAAGVPVEDLIA